MPGTGIRGHLRTVTASHLRRRFAGLSLCGAGKPGAAFGTQVSALKGTAGRGRERDVLGSFAIIHRSVRFGRSGEDESDGESRRKKQGFHKLYFLSF